MEIAYCLGCHQGLFGGR